MDFTDKEYDIIIARKIDKVAFLAGNNTIFTVDIPKLIQAKIEKDPMLKKQLLQHSFKSEE